MCVVCEDHLDQSEIRCVTSLVRLNYHIRGTNLTTYGGKRGGRETAREDEERRGRMGCCTRPSDATFFSFLFLITDDHSSGKRHSTCDEIWVRLPSHPTTSQPRPQQPLPPLETLWKPPGQQHTARRVILFSIRRF